MTSRHHHLARLAGHLAAAAVVVALLPGVAVAQVVDDDCYPIPEDGCPTEVEESVEVAPRVEVLDEAIAVSPGDRGDTEVLSEVLARTGIEAATLVALGVLLLVAGGFLVAVQRRRGAST